MGKKILFLTLVFLGVSRTALAGAAVVPEIPTGFLPMVLLGLAGAVLWIRSMINK